MALYFLNIFGCRYAITLWYFDASERQEACRRHKTESMQNMHNTC